MTYRTRYCAPLPRKGAATVELALVLPFLAFAFVAGVDYARIFYCSVIVANCARNGAACGSADAASANDQTAIQTAALADASNLGGQATVTSATDSSSAPTYVDVTVSYPFTTLTKYPAVPNSVTLNRTVRMRVAPAVPKFN